MLTSFKMQLYIMDLLCWGCEELQWRYRWQSMLSILKSVKILQTWVTLRSKNSTFSLDVSWVNLRLGQNWLSLSINVFNCFLLCVQIKTINHRYNEPIQMIEDFGSLENLFLFYPCKFMHVGMKIHCLLQFPRSVA